jgi:hypothetical protein
VVAGMEARLSRDKKRKPDFGKRDQKSVEPTERAPSATQRLREIGSRWWRASGLQKKKLPRAKGFKRSQRS